MWGVKEFRNKSSLSSQRAIYPKALPLFCLVVPFLAAKESPGCGNLPRCPQSVRDPTCSMPVEINRTTQSLKAVPAVRHAWENTGCNWLPSVLFHTLGL